ITVAEELGVGTRGGYYDGSGATRDMLQNHTMQLLALVAMEQPRSLSAEHIRDEKVKLLESIQPLRLGANADAVRAQYDDGLSAGEKVPGYLAEKGQDRTVATSIPAMLAGNAIVYVLGMAWLSHKLDVPMVDGEKTALSLGVTPFLAGDLFKTVLAGVLTPTAWKVLGRGRRD
ncbi:MAG: hypothetical protein EBX99_07045, partial [Acidimicrobiia bacterium]|nr:hypothetical protein [Acidimicrobiia bacterium]